MSKKILVLTGSARKDGNSKKTRKAEGAHIRSEAIERKAR